MMAAFGPTIRGAQPLGASPSRDNGCYPLLSLQLRRLAIAAIVSLSGCATLDAKVAIPVSCIKDAPAVPQTASEAEILAMSEYAATLTTWTERLELKAYAAKASAVIEACK